MSDVLDYAREKEPRFKDVPDTDLALYLGSRKPEFLKDPEFKVEYQDAATQKGIAVSVGGVNKLLKTLTNPAAGEAAQAGREELQAQRAGEQLPKINLDPYQKARLSGQEPVSGPFGPANPQEVLALPEILKAPAAVIDKSGVMDALEQIGADFLQRTGLNPAAKAGEPLAPSADAPSSTPPSPLEEAFPGVAKGLTEAARGFTTPGAAMLLPAMGLKPVQAAFRAQMAAGIPGSIQALYEARTTADISKAGAELVTQVLATVHGLKGKGGEQAKANEVAKVAPQTADALARTTTDVNFQAEARTQQSGEEIAKTLGLIRKVWDPAIPVVGGMQSFTDPKTGLTIEGIKPDAGLEEVRARMQQKLGVAEQTEEQSAPRTAGEPPVIQAGAAHVTEIPETGAGGEKYGVAQQVREERAKAGQVDPVQPGQGISMPDSIARGRQLNEANPGMAETLLQQFEADPERKFSADLISTARAHGEGLARAARAAESQFGTESPEYQAARDALSAWDKRTKPIQTEWHKAGQAQQSWTDLDTGSIAGLERERQRIAEKPFTPEETEQAGKLAKAVRETEQSTDEAGKAVIAELDQNKSPERQLEEESQKLTEAIRASNGAAERLAQAQEQLDAAQTERDVKEARAKVDAATKDQDTINKVARDAAAQKAKTERTVQERRKLDDQAKTANDALQAAHKTVRDVAVKVKESQAQLDAARKAQEAVWKVARESAVARAKAETKDRVAQADRDVKVARVQLDAAKKAQEAVWKVAREAARAAAKAERKILDDPSIPVWEKARSYLKAFDAEGREVPSGIRFEDLVAKVASDLGLSSDKVSSLLARSKRMKFLTDDLWLKRQRERNAKIKAKLWVQGLDTPAYEKFIHGLPRVLFALRVGFHGTVALGTHAPGVAFDPRFWSTYARNFGKMYKMVGSPAFYEGQMQNLIRRENYATALRAGLVVDPFKYEDFKYPGITSETTERIKDAMAKATGLDPNAFTKMGERGYSILKVLRQDMFDQHWEGLPKQLRTTDMARAIADAVNHITGVVKSAAPFGAELVAFAPKLQMSRAAFLFGDPIRAMKTGVRATLRATHKATGLGPMPEVTEAEKWFAINEAKSKGIMLGTLGSLLALNQGILMASGSKERVNLTDPFKSDFAKFKVAGHNVSYGNPLITMSRLPLRVGTLAMGPGGKLRKLIYPDEDAARMVWEYFRSQMSPFAALTADMVFREDWQGRQLPFSERPEPKRLMAQGIEPYTSGEYWGQQALPIPFQELMRESLKEGFGWSPVMSTLFMAATGGRVSEDYEMQQQ